MFRYCLLLLPLLLTACSSDGTRPAKAEKGRPAAATSYSEGNTGGDFYRRYSGMIANQPVVVQLHRFAGRFTGSYQYKSQGKLIWITEKERSGDSVFFSEYPPEPAADEQAGLVLAFGTNTLSGSWISAAGDKRLPVMLREEYPDGSSRLLAAHLEDTALLIEGKSAPFASVSYRYLLPEPSSPGFLGRSLIGLFANQQTTASNVEQALQSEVNAYFERYRRETRPLLQEDPDTATMFAFNFSAAKALEVLYNDNGWVVVRNLSGEYTGGMHGYYSSTFLNIDVSGARSWQAGDVFVDTIALKPMLNDAAISYFQLKPGKAMANRLLVDEVPPTGNMFITPTGIYFVYNPYEIASYADGEILLFLPYSKLTPLLTEAFRTRMKLGARAGVALRRSASGAGAAA